MNARDHFFSLPLSICRTQNQDTETRKIRVDIGYTAPTDHVSAPARLLSATSNSATGTPETVSKPQGWTVCAESRDMHLAPQPSDIPTH